MSFLATLTLLRYNFKHSYRQTPQHFFKFGQKDMPRTIHTKTLSIVYCVLGSLWYRNICKRLCKSTERNKITWVAGKNELTAK